ncbi:hypothetical protein CN689_22390 [Peribacillus butanolivorans]|uniref:Uncharacterized protein n=1 Tax=Peribacillus butanolivorans TaxID=421767 RepID=A0AAX0S0H2_9BACI|nr:hypothetical protein [Peribacillus butanolivorans]PEJ28307.1 hypothetical protein CN689_22390 [Peribacillus butanolivorans]
MKKFIIMSLVSFTLIFGVSTQASAAGYWFKTEDGRIDGGVTFPDWKNMNVQVDVWGLYGYSSVWGNGTYSPKKLKVRLCNRYSDNCTEYKYFTEIKKGYGRVNFYNVQPLRYDLYIVDTSVNTQVTGYSNAIAY